MIRSMLDDQPNWPVTKTHGESEIRFEMTTFSTLSPKFSLIAAQRPSYSLTSLSVSKTPILIA